MTTPVTVETSLSRYNREPESVFAASIEYCRDCHSLDGTEIEVRMDVGCGTLILTRRSDLREEVRKYETMTRDDAMSMDV